MGPDAGPWHINLVLPLALISKAFQFPRIRMVTIGAQGTYSVGPGLPICPGSAGSLQEDGHLTFLSSTPQVRIRKSQD